MMTTYYIFKTNAHSGVLLTNGSRAIEIEIDHEGKDRDCGIDIQAADALENFRRVYGILKSNDFLYAYDDAEREHPEIKPFPFKESDYRSIEKIIEF